MLNYILSLLTALVVTMFAIPSIIRVAELKSLFDVPGERKHHKKSIPTLGGMAIFAGLVFSVTFWTNQAEIVELQYIICAILILFFLGIKDDLIDLRAWKKLAGQILAAAILVHLAGIKLTTFYGLFGMKTMSLPVSYFFSVFTIIVITNAFNLIDGIDGLAASIGILSAATFGSWYYALGMTQYAILSFALIGSLLGFLWFNRSPAKIFMGDTGSMLVGLIVAILAIKFIDSIRTLPRAHPHKILTVPVFTLSVLIVPLYDTLRVFLVRMLKKKSPFSADRSHIHHLLVDRGLSHMQSTAILVVFNLVMIVGAFYAQGIRGEIQIAALLLIPTAFTVWLLRTRSSR
jgi:UDP-N-acetylmuramyl pentapeptide phosphotransferase/UDP-N-acetylglucosamine-1-phosphate transferase